MRPLVSLVTYLSLGLNGDGTAPEKAVRSNEKRDSAQALCLLYRKNMCAVDLALWSCSTTRQVLGTVGLPMNVIAKAE